MDALARLFQALPIEQLLCDKPVAPLKAALTLRAFPPGERLRLQMAVVALLKTMEDKTLLMKHAHWLLSCLNLDESYSATHRKVLNKELLSLVRRAIAAGAAAAAIDAKAGAQADAGVGNVDSGSGGDAQDRAYPLSADENDVAASLFGELRRGDSNKVLYAFERGILPHYLFQPSLGELVVLATCNAHAGEAGRAATHILLALPGKWVVPAVVARVVKVQGNDEQREVWRVAKYLLDGYDQYTGEIIIEREEENQQFLVPQAEAIAAAVLQLGEEPARDGQNHNLFSILLQLPQSVITRIIKEMLIPAATYTHRDSSTWQ